MSYNRTFRKKLPLESFYPPKGDKKTPSPSRGKERAAFCRLFHKGLCNALELLGAQHHKAAALLFQKPVTGKLVKDIADH